MITTLITGSIGFILTAIFYFLPVVTISSIPVIGTAVSGYIDTIVTTWNAFMITFPYAQTGWDVFIYVILPFEILLLLGKMFLGSRVPSHVN